MILGSSDSKAALTIALNWQSLKKASICKLVFIKTSSQSSWLLNGKRKIFSAYGERMS
jgi:hypothetical protein